MLFPQKLLKYFNNPQNKIKITLEGIISAVVSFKTRIKFLTIFFFTGNKTPQDYFQDLNSNSDFFVRTILKNTRILD